MTDKNSPSLKKDKMPSIRTPQSAKATESKSLKRKLFEDGEKKTSKPASIKRKKTNSQPGSPTLNTARSHPLSERQQLALLKQLTAKEAKDSPGNNGCGQTPKHDSQTISTFKKGINKKNDKGETALHRAAIQGDVQVAKNLIKQGADVNVQDFACWTPLHEACNHGSYDVAKQLLKAGAYVNILGLEDDTPLHDAVINGHVKLVELLLKHGANPLQVNKKGKAPLDLAISHEIRALMRNEIIESCSDSSLIEANSPSSPEGLDSAEESSNLGRDTNGQTLVHHVPEPVVDPYEFPPDQQPTGEQKITIHYKVPVKNGKSARVMDVIKIPKTTQTIHAQQQDRNSAGTPNSIDSLSSGDSDLFDPHLNTKSDKSSAVNDVYSHDKPQGPSILTAAASTPSSSSTPKHATPRLPVQEQSELARIPETRDDSESSLSESNLYISDDSNLTAESRISVAGKADSTTESLTFSLGHPIEKKHPNLLRNIANASVLSTCTPADSSDSNVCIPNTNYSRVPLPASAPREASSSLQSVSVAAKTVTDLRTSSLPTSVQTTVQHTHHHHHQQQSANLAGSRNSPDSQALLDSRRIVTTESNPRRTVTTEGNSRRTATIESNSRRIVTAESNSRRNVPLESSSIHAAVSAKHSSVEEQVISQTGNRQPSVLPQDAQVHIDKPDLKSESESDSLSEWRTEAKTATVSEPRPESESSDSLSEKPHRERSKKHKERSDKKSHRKHHRHQGSSVRSSKEDRHVNEENNASFTSSTRSPSRNPSTDGESRTEASDGNKSDPQNTKDSHSSKDSSQQQQQRQSSPQPPRFNSAREYYIVTPPPSSTADDSTSEIKTLLIRRNPNMVQSKPKEPPTTASSNSAQSVSSTSASSPTENTSKTTDKDSKPSTSTAGFSIESRTALPSSNEASNRKSPSIEVGNRKSPITRDLERRKSPARGSPDITSSVSGSSQAGGSGKSSPKTVEPPGTDESKPKVTRTLRSNSNLNAATTSTTTTTPDNNGNNESKTEMTVMTRSRRAAESSNGNGNSCMPEPQNVESHPRKRKIARHKLQQPEEPPYPLPTPLPPQDKVNTMEMFINIRNEVSQRQKTLIADVQPKIPNGFHEYLICRKSYLLQSSPETKVNGVIPQVTPPPELPSPLLTQFQEQEKMRYMLRMRHYIEREKLMLSAEQDIMRVHGKAARAYANQRMPLSACVVFRDQEIYNMPEPLPPDDGKNIRTRFNGRQLYSLLQDVDMKYERIKEELLQRHSHEATSLYAMQRLDWELKLQELKMWDLKSPTKISEEHVPMVQVNRDFDLLPPV